MPKRIDVDRQDGTTRESARRFDARDLKWLADWGVEEFNRRQNTDDRRDKEKEWKEIDRQIAMKPEIAFKKLPNGQIDMRKAWMAEMEMPLQAQTLEVLTADARRMLFPDSGPWFRAHAEVGDKYLEKVNFKSPVLGDDAEVPTEITQDNADKLVEGFLAQCFGQYDHVARFDQINAESFKYGMGVARARKERKSVYIHETRGTRREDRIIPVIVPGSIRHIYPDDAKPSMHTVHALAPVHISHEWTRYENLAIMANKGSNDPDNEDGGWMPQQVGKIEPDDKGFVQLIEIEGDVVVPRKTVRSVVLPGIIITIALGGAESPSSPASRAVVRLRYRKQSFSSYLFFPYHYEGAGQVYPTSPLMKGRPIQMMVTDALNRLLDSSMLKTLPPIGYDSNNQAFASAGGPVIHPGALWETSDPVKVYAEVGGDPSALLAMWQQGINLYAQLTGVLPARLGAQTISHTTAYAKGAELQQGAVRTVDYVNASGKGPITRWLDMAYTLGRDALGANETISFYIEAYGGYVEVDKSFLPENVMFEWFGSGGPQERSQKQAEKLNALQLALKMDMLAIQMGKPATVNITAAIQETLRDGGWYDLDAITNGQATAPAALPAPNPGAATVALQGLSGGEV